MEGNENGLDIEIEAGTTEAEQSTKKLDEALEKLQSTLEKLSSSVDKNTSALQNFGEQEKKVEENTEKTNTSMLKNIKTIGRMGTALGLIVKSLINSSRGARDFETTMNYFNTVFGTANTEMRDFVNNMSRAFMIDSKDVMAVASNFGAFASSVGLTSQQSNILSRNLTQLAYDISALRGGDVSSWAAKLQSAVSGQGKALKEAGLGYTNASLQAYALSKNYGITVTNLDAASKAQLTYNYIIDRSGLYQGQFAKKIGNTNNQLYIFQQQVQVAARSIGNVLIPAINIVLPYLIGFFNALQRLFGLSDINWGDGISDPIANIGGALDNASSSAKKLRQNLLGIDELNIVSPDTSTDGAGGYSGLGTSMNFDLAKYDNLMNKVQTKAQEISDWLVENKDLVKALGIALGVTFGISKLSDFTSSLGDIKNGLQVIYDNWDKLAGLGAIILSVNLGGDFISDWSAGNYDWQTFGEEIGSAIIGGVGVGLLTGSGVAGLVTAIIALAGFIVYQLSTKWDEIGKGWRDMWDNAKKTLDDFINKGGVGLGLLGDILKQFLSFVSDIIGSIWSLVGGLGKGIIKIFQGDVFGGLKTIGVGLVNFLVGILNALIDALNFFLSPFRAIVVGIANIVGANWSMNTVAIPHVPKVKMSGYAKGGLFTSRVDGATIGEAGREAVLPLTNKNVMSEIASSIMRYSDNENTTGDSGVFDITLNLDGEKIYNNQQKIARRKGASITKGAFAT